MALGMLLGNRICRCTVSRRGGGGMTRLLLVAADFAAVLAAAGVGRVGLSRCPRKRGSSSV